MRRNYFLILIFFMLNVSVFSQFQIGIDGMAGLLKTNPKSTFNPTLGIEFNAGYSFNRKIDLSLKYNKLWTGFEEENFYSIGIESNYNFSFKYIKPYLGFGIAYNDFKVTIFEEHHIYSFEVFPNIGLLIDTDLFNGLFVNIEYNFKRMIPFNKDYRKTSTSTAHLFSIGLKYYFVKKATTK